MREGEDYNYAIVKINHQTGSSVIIDVVKGQSNGASIAGRRKAELTDDEKAAGWSCYAERTTKPVWQKTSPRRPLKRDRGKS